MKNCNSVQIGIVKCLEYSTKKRKTDNREIRKTTEDSYRELMYSLIQLERAHKFLSHTSHSKSTPLKYHRIYVHITCSAF